MKYLKEIIILASILMCGIVSIAANNPCDDYTITIKSIEFTSDHETGSGFNKLINNNSDWSIAGAAYARPEWVNSPSRSYPISHTKNAKITVKITLSVSPSGTIFDLKGDGPNNYVDFNSTGNRATGSDQAITITADEKLPDNVDILNKTIKWQIKPDPLTIWCDMASSTHKIYVTFGTPVGKATERRIEHVCSSTTGAGGKQDLTACANTIFDKHATVAYDLDGDLWGPSNIWDLHNAGEKSQCPGVAEFLNVHFEMLGLGSGTIKYCRAKPDGTYEAPTSIPSEIWRLITPGTGHPDPTAHDDEHTEERFVMVDGALDENNYEAALWFDGHFYCLPFSRSETTAKGVVQAAFLPPGAEWQYRTGTIGSYDFHKCLEDPWVEASEDP